jgi:hypothetical protein
LRELYSLACSIVTSTYLLQHFSDAYAANCLAFHSAKSH